MREVIFNWSSFTVCCICKYQTDDDWPIQGQRLWSFALYDGKISHDLSCCSRVDFVTLAFILLWLYSRSFRVREKDDDPCYCTVIYASYVCNRRNIEKNSGEIIAMGIATRLETPEKVFVWQHMHARPCSDSPPPSPPPPSFPPQPPPSPLSATSKAFIRVCRLWASGYQGSHWWSLFHCWARVSAEWLE